MLQVRTLLLLAALLAPALPASAQAPRSAPAPDEITRIQERLAALQQQALQDSAVAAGQEAFQASLAAAMVRLDPAAAQRMARAEALPAEVEAARGAEDNAKLNQLAAEASELQRFFQALRSRVLALPDIQERHRAFLAVVAARMAEIDPQAPVLIERLQQLRSGGS